MKWCREPRCSPLTLYRRQGSRPSPWKRNAKKAKWLSGEALQIAVKRREAKSKGEKERYKHLPRSALEKDPRPGPLFEGNPVGHGVSKVWNTTERLSTHRLRSTRRLERETEIAQVDRELIWCCCSVAKSCPTLCDLMDCRTPGFPVLHYLLESTQIHPWKRNAKKAKWLSGEALQIAVKRRDSTEEMLKAWP